MSEGELWKEGNLSLWLYVDSPRSIRLYLWKNKDSYKDRIQIIKTWYRPIFKERAIRRALKYARLKSREVEGKKKSLMQRLREVAAEEEGGG